MIWDLIEETTFDKYFSDQNLSIKTLLLDENIITQLKNQNPKLLQYLEKNKHQFMIDLINYVVILPKEEEGYDRCYKLPYISSQLLALDSELIYSQFFNKKQQNQYWTLLLTFLESAGAENNILMGYFQKVINNLYNGNKCETTKIVHKYINKFVALIIHGSIADTIKKVLVLLQTPEGAVLNQRKDILRKIVQILKVCDEQSKKSCVDVLCQVINRFQVFSSGQELISYLFQDENYAKIYHLQDNKSIKKLVSCLLKKLQQKIINENDEKVSLLKMSNQHKKMIEQYVLRQYEFIINQSGQKIRKSNQDLYLILQVMVYALQQKINNFVNQIIIKNLWTVCIMHPFNNILHALVLKIFTYIINDEKIQNNVINNYQRYILNIQQKQFKLMKQFIYTIWKQCSKYQRKQTDKQIIQKFDQYVAKYFKPLLQYQIKKINHSPHIQRKLIVDQEDKPNKQQIVKYQIKQQVKQQIKQQKEDIALKNIQKQKQKPKQIDPFDFFNSYSTKKTQEQKSQKKDMFGDFSSFF